jgi:hypothetical protein
MPTRTPVQGDLFHGRIPEGAIYIGRAAPGLRQSRWANPHRVGWCKVCDLEHDQAGAVDAYARDLSPEQIAAARAELAGHDLACWCRTGPCHVDILLAVANSADPTGSDHASAGRIFRSS